MSPVSNRFGPGRDPNAAHTDTAGEIDGLSEKSAVASDDLLMIEDSADSNAKKKVTVANLLNAEYAEIYVESGETTQTTNSSADTFDVITGFNTDAGANGESNVAVANKAANKITLTTAGKYQVLFSISWEGTTNEVYHIHAFVDGTKHDATGLKRKIGTGTDVGCASFAGILTATAGQDLDVRVAAAGTESDFTPRFMNLTAIRIGP